MIGNSIEKERRIAFVPSNYTLQKKEEKSMEKIIITPT